MADDLICRQDAIKAVYEQRMEAIGCIPEAFNDGIDASVSALEKIPSADAEPVIHGKWLTAYGDHISFGVRPHVSFCSECNEVTAFKYRYCPNCGARMRGYDNG